MNQSMLFDPDPLGVPLDELHSALKEANVRGVSRRRDSVVVDHPNCLTWIRVQGPSDKELEATAIKAIVTVRSTLSSQLKPLFIDPVNLSALNRFATLGAITGDADGFFIGSRLTTYEEENAWAVYYPLLFFTALAGGPGLLGAMHRASMNLDREDSRSMWTKADFDLVGKHLSQICFCNHDSTGLTAEFSLGAENVSAMMGDRKTALWELRADQPHPDLGGGLFCLLQLPHQIPDLSVLGNILNHLNRLEMAPQDLPPHFGAWCVGRLGNNPAYQFFLPNGLQSVFGIAVNVSGWANIRAQWANKVLNSLGFEF